MKKHGIRASHTADVHLDDCRVPGSCLLGGKEKLDERLAKAREGKSSKGQAAMRTFELSRPTVGAQAVGIARAAYEYALDYAKEREAFGRKIIENQAIAFTLADMKMEIDAARLLVHRAAWMGKTGKDFDARRGLDVEAEGRRGRRLGDRAGDPDPRRQRLLARVPGRADAPRRQDLDDLRGHLGDPAPGDHPGDLRACRSSEPRSGDRRDRRLGQSRRRSSGPTRRSSCTATRSASRPPATGPLLVLLHGITSTAEAWREVMPRLAERYTVIAPDLLGHGRSAKPRGDYSLGAYAAGVRDLLAVLGFERGTVVGHSLRRRDRDAVRLPLPRVRRADGADLLRRPRPRGPPAAPRRHPARAPSGCCRCSRASGRCRPATRSARSPPSSASRPGPTWPSSPAATPRWSRRAPARPSSTRCAA